MTGDIKDTGSTVDSEEPIISTTGYDYEVKLKISRSARSKLPENFNIHEIGNIDLKEAEAIANEDILFLTENDLIEGLEDFDLIPLNDDVKHRPIQDTELGNIKVNSAVTSETINPSVSIKNEISEKPVKITDEIINKDSKKENIKYNIEDLPNNKEIVSSVDGKNILQKDEDSKSIKNKPEKSIKDDTLNDNQELFVIDANKKSSIEYEIKNTSSIETPKDYVDLEKSISISSDDILTDIGAADSYLQIKPSLEKEKLPEWVYALESTADKTYFIDDETVDNEKRSVVLNFEEKELEKITSRIIETFDVTPKILIEADIEDDKENIAYTSSSIAPVFDDLLIDFEDDELKYRDDDLDFIHSAIIEEDFSKYLRLIDEYHGTSGETKITAAVELLGLTNDELDDISDSLYANDYKGINLEEIFSIIKNQSALNYKNAGRNKTCTYLLSDVSSLLPEEKLSIEADISSEFALIYEEDVEQLKSHLKKIFVETKPDSVKVVEEIYDITDRIVILEDESDMRRFVKEIPEHKRDDLVRLMKYLDGMFEKLPENAVKNFADSEYFNLYVKILNDLGI